MAETAKQESATEEAAKKVRSPQFPFIDLEKAVARAKELEAQYKNHQARVVNAVKVWNYGEKSSGGIQTIAALSAYGLLDDEGSLEARKLRLTSLAMTILKDVRPGIAKDALKVAALKPKMIAELWKLWGASRPPDAECVSMLHLDMKFTEEAASRLLAIYDKTIKYADLAETDKNIDNDDLDEADESELDGDKDENSSKPPPKAGKVQLMANERVVFAHELRPNQSFRIVVAGDVDAEMVKALKAFANFQEALIGPAKSPVSGESGGDLNK